MYRSVYFRTGPRGIPRPLPDFMYHGEYARLDAHESGLKPGESEGEGVARWTRPDGMVRTCRLALVRGRNGRPFIRCPFCDKPRATLYVFLRRMELPRWRPRVPVDALACRACHQIKYVSQYTNRYRDLARGGLRFGFYLRPEDYRREDRAEREWAVRAERHRVHYERTMERHRARRARAERLRRARKRRAGGPDNATPSTTP